MRDAVCGIKVIIRSAIDMTLSGFTRAISLVFIGWALLIQTPEVSGFDVMDVFTEQGFWGIDTTNFIYHSEHHKKYKDHSGKRLPGHVSAAAQGIKVLIDSDYFANELVGIGLAAYGSYRIDALGNDHFGSGLLNDIALPDYIARGNIYRQARPSSYTKLGQLYIKWRIGEPNAGTRGRAGLISMDSPLLNDVITMEAMDARTVPSSTRGGYAELRTPLNINIYVGYSDGASEKTDEGYHRYSYTDPITGQKEEWKIILVGARYGLPLRKYDLGFGKLDFEVAGATGLNYMAQEYFNIRYSLSCGIWNWDIESHVYLGQSIGELYDKPYRAKFGAGVRPYNSKLWDFSLAIAFTHVKWVAGYQEVNGPKYDYRWDSYGDRQLDETAPRIINYVQYLDFSRKNERSWQLRNDLKLAKWGYEGWMLTNSYSKGRFREIGKIKKSHEWERDLDVSYEFGGNLKGLLGKLRYATARSAIKSANVDEVRLVFEYSKRFY